MTEEKRRFSRFSFDTKAELTIEGRTYRVDEIKNLSIGGCLLEISSLECIPDQPCSLKIILKVSGDEPDVFIEGKIVRCENGTFAMSFTRIDMENLFHLQNIARFNSDDPDRIEEEIKEHPGII